MKNILLGLLLFFSSAFAQKHPITIDDLWSMNRIGSFDVSPNSELIVFNATKYSMEENKGNSDIYLLNLDTKEVKVLLNDKAGEYSPEFLTDNLISFVKNGQIWHFNLETKELTKKTDIYTGIGGPVYSPDKKSVLFSSEVYPNLKTQEENKKRDEEKENSKVKAKIITELMYKSWNRWHVDKRSHLFFHNLETKLLKDITEGSNNDVPPIDLGSAQDYSFSPDGNEIAFVQNPDKVVATSTNNDIWIYQLGSDKAPEKISVSKGNDHQPVYSPDGKYLAFCSMKRAGFEADKKSLVLYDRYSKELIPLTEDLDISVGQYVWSPDSKYIYYLAANEIYNSIYKFDIQEKENTLLIKEVVASGLTISHDGNTLYFKNQKSTMPNEIFSISTDGKDLTQLTNINEPITKNIVWNEVETFWSEGANGAKVQSILVKPPHFDPNKKYPLILLIHGGPQGHWKDDFHYRWNLQMFAAPGYVVVAVNPRGSTGYGQKFTDEISKDWGGKVYTDLMNSLDNAIAKYSFIDENKLYAAGASYGGYMINWIEGHTDRFNALVCHAGVYNLVSMYGTTEELWFPEWEMGGTPWENPELYKKWSPSNYVENFKTPMLVVHGAFDFRVPEGQAFELFTALQKMNVESKFLYYPDEYHFVVKPQNAKLWWETLYDWFKKH